MFEVYSSTEWSFQQFQPVFHPNLFVDIAATLEAKIAGMQVYESEMRIFLHPRSPDALRALAQCRGNMVGLYAAEAFEAPRILR